MNITLTKQRAWTLWLVYGGIALTNLAWGASFVAARLLLHASRPDRISLTPTMLAATRFGLASLAFIAPFIRAVVRREIWFSALWRMFVLGQLTYALYFWLQYTGVQNTNAGIASILVVGLIPLVTAVVARLFGAERLRLATVGALIAGGVGVAVIVWPSVVAPRPSGAFLFGAACLVANAFAFALYSNLTKRWLHEISPLVVTGGTMLSGALGLMALAVVTSTPAQWHAVAQLSARQWGALAFLILGCSVLGYFAYNVALQRIDASRAALYIYSEPVVAVALGVALLGEALTLWTIAGTLIIAASVVLVTLQQRTGQQT